MTLARRLGRVAVGTLIAFHGALFANQAFAGNLDASRALRWAGAVGLALAFRELGTRARGGLARKHAVLALWIVAALLHAPAVAEHADDAPFAGPTTLAILTSSWSAGVFVACLAAGFARRGSFDPALAFLGIRGRVLAPAFKRVAIRPFAPRPPPNGQLTTSFSF